MALLFIEGFEGYTTNGASMNDTLVYRRYAGGYYTGQMTIRPGRIAGLCLEMAWVDSCWLSTHALTTDDTLIIGFAVKFGLFSSGAHQLIRLWDGLQSGMAIYVTVAGELEVHRDTTTLASTSGLNLVANQWYYLEFKVKCASGTSGTYEIRIDGTDVLSSSGANTQAGANAYHDKVQLVCPCNKLLFDDMYICDSTGALNTDFLGNCKVVAINPDGEDTVNFSTVYPALSDHYADVDDGAAADDDTTYVEDGTTGHRDLFTYAQVSGVLTTIYGVSVNTTCRVTDANAVTLKTVVSNNGSETVSSGESISDVDYKVHTYICELDPETSLPWDTDTINDVEYGFEIG